MTWEDLQSANFDPPRDRHVVNRCVPSPQRSDKDVPVLSREGGNCQLHHEIATHDLPRRLRSRPRGRPPPAQGGSTPAVAEMASCGGNEHHLLSRLDPGRHQHHSSRWRLHRGEIMIAMNACAFLFIVLVAHGSACRLNDGNLPSVVVHALGVRARTPFPVSCVPFCPVLCS
jgi:hypothetical protein